MGCGDWERVWLFLGCGEGWRIEGWGHGEGRDSGMEEVWLFSGCGQGWREHCQGIPKMPGLEVVVLWGGFASLM